MNKLWEWLLQTNRKEIRFFLFTLAAWAGIIGLFFTSLAILICAELIQPGALLTSDQLYSVIVWMHVLAMIAFLAMPLVIWALMAD